MYYFREYKENMKKKFVGVFFDDKTQKRLMEYCLDLGFDLTKNYAGDTIKAKDFDFHTTIFFTTSEHDTKNGKAGYNPFKIYPQKFEILGKDKQIPVIKVMSDSLLDVRKDFEEMGYKDEWPSYKPHVSLSYNWDGTPDLDDIELPDFDFRVKNIVIEDQD